MDGRFRPLGASLNRRRLLASSLAAAAVLTAGPTQLRRAAAETADTASFLGSDSVHRIAVAFDADDYGAMIATFQESGDKDWLKASVTIDGVSYEKAGMRLKGNSSLSGLRGGMAGVRLPDGGEATVVAGREAPADGGDQVTIRRDAGGGASADEPERLPWLIRLDKYVDGQRHDGMTDLVIRSNVSQTSLNEAVALDLLDLGGLASQRAAFTRFAVNGGADILRLAVELPNDSWMARHFSVDGLLYKAESGGDFSYRGDDAEAYDDIFDLEAGGTGDDSDDFAPLTGFLEFINNADDATFVAELPVHLDVELFAVYLAMMDLIANFDDIDGPGNNAYLYVGPDAERFTVVPWDMNLAFGSMGVGRFDVGGESDAIGGPSLVIVPGEEENEGAAATPVAGGAGGVDVPRFEGEMRGGPMGGRNIVVERCNAMDGFTELVEQTKDRLRAELFASGQAASVLQRWENVLTDGASDLVSVDTITSEGASIAAYFES